MNIAFPAFLIFLGILPGFIFYLTFHNIEDTYLNYEPLTRKTIISVFTAILLHICGLPLLFFATGNKINSELILMLMSGSQGTEYIMAVKLVGDNLLGCLAYIALLCVFAFMLAKFFRWIIKLFSL